MKTKKIYAQSHNINTAPESNWQAVFDDKHQSYYYWDTRGGRCVWEVPAEYQDFLQAYQDFEVSMVKYEEEFQEWQRLGGCGYM